MQDKSKIPFLPGNVIASAPKEHYYKGSTLGFINGYPVQKIASGEVNEDSESVEKLLEALNMGAKTMYNTGTTRESGQFVPAHVAFDKVVLTFDAYFKQTVHDSVEQYYLRKVKILFFLEDESLAVIEPPIENSGIPQGVLIKRQKMPKSSSEFYKMTDFNLGQNVTFYAKTFRIVSCDKFTRDYMESQGHILSEPETMPVDPFRSNRARPVRLPSEHAERKESLKKFFEMDRKVLRFYCVWDDRSSMFGELREFIMHYHLVDDSIEVREVQTPNNGRDSFPILLRRKPLPKEFGELSDLADGEQYSYTDLKIGAVINVLGRPFLIRDCDAYTRRFYEEAYKKGEPVSLQTSPIPLPMGKPSKTSQDYPPYNGFGTVEDSLGSCKHLVLKPPKKDFIKMLENERKILRFVAKMKSHHREDKDRRFVVSYRLADDMMTIYEPPQRNAGIIGGKFMERTRVLYPGSSLSDPKGPKYYEIKDLYLGANISVLGNIFVLLDADEYVFNYLEAMETPFEHSNRNLVLEKVRNVIESLNPKEIAELKLAFETKDEEKKGVLDRNTFVAIVQERLPMFNAHEIVTFSRTIEQISRFPEYKKLF